MALLTAEERASLGRFNVINQHLDIAQRLTDAETIQCVGDTATAHARLLALPQPGDTLRVEGSGALDRTGSFVPGCDVTYEFTTGPPVSAGHVPVLIGATPAETATTLAAIITRTTTLPVVAAAHSIDTTTVDVCHTIPGAPLTLSSSAGGRCVTQSNNEQLPIDCYVLILRRRTITAEDVARGSIRFDT